MKNVVRASQDLFLPTVRALGCQERQHNADNSPEYGKDNDRNDTHFDIALWRNDYKRIFYERFSRIAASAEMDEQHTENRFESQVAKKNRKKM